MDETRSLTYAVYRGLIKLLLWLLLLVFFSAGTLAFWQGWLFLLVFFTTCSLFTAYFLKHDPALIKRRLKAGPRAEKERSQKIIMAFASVLFLLLVIVPGLDHRFHLSHMPLWLVLAGDAMVAGGYLIIFRVFQENSFASAIIEIGEDQRVISTGPYRIVRHPMYAGGLIMLLGVPLALGSYWGVVVFVPLIPVLIKRLSHEEDYLVSNLPGYAEYRSMTIWRLIPGLY